jgi:ribonuclease Y
MEAYIKRLETLENIARQYKGVEAAFAIQAGREVRIIVKPEAVDDLEAMRIARDVSQEIESTMEYPGQIKVTVVRETRATEYAK